MRGTVNEHGAGAALAVVAALLGAGEMQLLAQRIEQRSPGLDIEVRRLAVDMKIDADRKSAIGRGHGHHRSLRELRLVARARKLRRRTEHVSVAAAPNTQRQAQRHVPWHHSKFAR